MKKQILTVLLLCLLLTVTLLLVACNDTGNTPAPTPDEPGNSANADNSTNKPDGEEPTHTHAYGAWTTVTEANCTEDGTKERVCSCGEKETAAIPATGHSIIIDAAKAATCTKTGLTAGKHCTVCNAVLVAQEVIPITTDQAA